MTALVVANTTVRQDTDGRYCLNDLHRAAGGANKHRPSLWVENQQTRALVAHLEGEAGIPALVSIHGGGAPGTFAVRELVYAYAMWISAAFHLQVIRAYDALATGKLDPLAALSDPATLRQLLLGYTEQVQQLQQVVQEQAPKVEALDRIADAHGAVCLTDAAKALQMRRADLIDWMQAHGWIYKRLGSPWIAMQPRIKAGMMVHKVVIRGEDGDERLYGQALVTPRGLAKLGELLAKERAAA